MLAHPAVTQTGTKVINARTLPVYRHTSGKQFVQVPDQMSNTALLVSPEGAKALKNGQYPIHPDLKPVVLSEIVNDEVPFALRSEGAQVESTQRLLKALMDRIIDSGLDFTFMEN